MQGSIPGGFTQAPRPSTSSVPAGFDRVIPLNRGRVSTPAIVLYKNGAMAMTRALSQAMPPDEYERLVIAVSLATGQLYIGPAMPGESVDTFVNPASGLVNTKATIAAAERLGMKPGNLYPMTRFDNGWVTGRI